ncbi:MAG: DUF1203 domain-containing protein [Dyella sp.]|nr:DUF1203 domain-containing protein [Dyella sp.]
MHFRITGLPAEPFAELFSLSDDALAERRAVRVVADQAHGYPCRISLTDAEPGQSLILLHYEHHAVDSPFRSSHAIYVREDEHRYDRVDEVPNQLRRRLLSVRGFDERGMLRDADVVKGTALEPLIERLFADGQVSYLHIHMARPGCYAARVDRA